MAVRVARLPRRPRATPWVAMAVAASVVVMPIGGTAIAATTTAHASDGSEQFGAHRVADVDMAALAAGRGAGTGRYLIQVDGIPLVLQDTARTRSKAETMAARAAVLQAMAPVAQAVVSLGGSVDQRYADVVIGMAVTIPSSQVDALRKLPGIASIEPVRIVRRANTVSDSYTGAASAWTEAAATGKGIKIAVIDTGIDYTHADFGGPGTATAYATNDRTTIEPGSFPTAKVVGGTDLVGDDYDALSADPARRIPKPDPDPIGCGPHGTHVAGTAAGFGVTADGQTFTGPWTAANAKGLSIGPGTAPQALLMAYQVFGCEGYTSTDITVAAINQAVADGADVINMSLGSDYGASYTLDAIASDNAAKAGVVVVAAAGNSGPSPYLVGSPGTSTRAISVAAMDAHPTLGGGTITAAGQKIDVLDANAAPLPVTGVVRVIRDSAGEIGLGCTPADFGNAAGTIAVVVRGVCARVDKVAAGQAAGAVGVIMVNQSPGFPPFEGPIDQVTIPFLGVSSSDAKAIAALDGTSITVQPSPVANPAYRLPTDFSSSGPRSIDSGIKPDLIAPGADVVSSLSGSGALSTTYSGTSMATPVVAGIAALVRQRHPRWSAAEVKAALTGTASTSAKVIDASDRQLSGAGLIQARVALDAPLLLLLANGASGINFGVLQPEGSLTKRTKVVIRNPGSTTIHVQLAIEPVSKKGVGTFTLSPASATIPAGGSMAATVTYAVTADQVRAIAPVAGVDPPKITAATITATADGKRPIRMPVQAIVLARSAISGELRGGGSGSITLRNQGLATGAVDVYDWIIDDPRDPIAPIDLRALGYQVLPAGDKSPIPGDQIIVFAINQFGLFSNPARNEYVVRIDANRDGIADHAAYGIDELFAETGATVTSYCDGVFVALSGDLTSFKAGVMDPVAPMNGSTVLIPVLASDLGITSANQLASVSMQVLSVGEDLSVADESAAVTVNLWDPQRKAVDPASGHAKIPAGKRISVPVSTRTPVAGETPSLGWMVASVDDQTGTAQADLLAAVPAS